MGNKLVSHKQQWQHGAKAVWQQSIIIKWAFVSNATLWFVFNMWNRMATTQVFELNLHVWSKWIGRIYLADAKLMLKALYSAFWSQAKNTRFFCLFKSVWESIFASGNVFFCSLRPCSECRWSFSVELWFMTDQITTDTSSIYRLLLFLQSISSIVFYFTHFVLVDEPANGAIITACVYKCEY